MSSFPEAGIEDVYNAVVMNQQHLGRARLSLQRQYWPKSISLLHSTGEGIVPGMRILHPFRGLGYIVDIKQHDARNKPYVIEFDGGETHSYSADSAAKLRIVSSQSLIPGSHVLHLARGEGTVTSVTVNNRNKPFTISFDSGEIHQYSLASAQKLRLHVLAQNWIGTHVEDVLLGGGVVTEVNSHKSKPLRVVFDGGAEGQYSEESVVQLAVNALQRRGRCGQSANEPIGRLMSLEESLALIKDTLSAEWVGSHLKTSETTDEQVMMVWI
jgi:hypothetical protein